MDRDGIGDRRFSSLSIKDLLEAREAYHVHLAHLDNVFATAIGRYLIRDEDPDAADPAAAADAPRHVPRTLSNSSVRPWSWPCILVFVDRWNERSAFASRPDQIVPRFLYLPDGRVVPTCVVAADRVDPAAHNAPPPAFPSDLLGGGFPALQEVQGRQRLSSMGCLVTDGDQVYVLTNRHVTGEVGREVYTVVAGRRQRVGVSAGRDIGKRRFDEVYPGWHGARVLLNLDAGLIRIDDVTRWTAQVYGVGEIGPVWDLHVDSFNLGLIGCPVRAYGAAGGSLQGQIQALFFRYKSVGGYEYVSDFLIGPRAGQHTVGTRAGDSGTLWFEDSAETQDAETTTDRKPRRLRPFAVQWGGQTLASPGAPAAGSFALATCLSTICRELDVEIIADWNTGQPETWGAVGHFKVGTLACELVAHPWLKQLLMLNRSRIGYDDATLTKLPSHAGADFVPLADVADFVWRRIRKLDDNNHFADIDRKAPADLTGKEKTFAGKSLLELTERWPSRVRPAYWNRFYDAVKEKKRGALPFRVWQIFDEMRDFAKAGDLTKFVCAAGLMAHYVGDACQPLHVSELHHGSSEEESGVHSAYETAMLNRYAAEMIAALGALRDAGVPSAKLARTGHDAAVAVVELMRRTVTRLPPQRVIEVYSENAGRSRTKAMWEQLGEPTAACLFDGAVTLARLWEGAWRAGRGKAANPKLPGKAVGKPTLAALYTDNGFLPSYKLQDIVEKNGRLVRAET